MRKSICFTLGVLMLAGCSGNNVGKAEQEMNGEKVSAVVEMDGNQIASISIDETTQGISKKEKKENYGLKKYSSINKEWYEQIAFLEEYLMEHGSDAITFDEQGRAQNTDVLSGCTISIEKYVDVFEEAKADAME